MEQQKRLIGYQPALHEALLLAWFFELRKTGDLDKIAHPSIHTLTAFLNHFTNVVKMGFANDIKGLYFAAWVHPLLDAGEFGAWVREDKRHSPSVLKCLYEAYDICFESFNVLIGISKQEHLKDIHEKLGYTSLTPEIPSVWAGNPVQIYFLTKDSYNGTRRIKREG